MKRALALGAMLCLGACGKLDGFGGAEPPLSTFQVRLDGDLTALRPAGVTSDHALRVAVVWGAQWHTEPLCILPTEDDATTKVLTRGCRDPLGFVPARVDASVAIAPGQTASLPLYALPTPDVLVGDRTGRVAYASFVVYDDVDDSGTLELSRPHRTPAGGRRADELNNDIVDSNDIIYGASFVTMTAADQRVAYLEGAFDPEAAFYPRVGCPTPRLGFSVVGAGGFSKEAATSATLMGILPRQDPASCSDAAPGATIVDVAASAPADVVEVGCDERTNDGSSRYREPPTTSPDLTGRLTACAPLPAFDVGALGAGSGADGGSGAVADGGGIDGGGTDGGAAVGASSLIQLVVSGRTSDRCKGLTHYTLRGCRENVSCVAPDWDFTANPPSWWPCPR
ncbi:MAG: hypothetical protein JWM82_2179 [Myxococcales bacterium]|nr:hypothetical protein [Myxococcales bacterium]